MSASNGTAGRYAIIVDFDLKPGALGAFMAHLAENARASVDHEPGCYRFDVLTPRETGDDARVTLYEIYTDRAAFDAHLLTPHFLAFKTAIGDLVHRQALVEFDVSENAKASA